MVQRRVYVLDYHTIAVQQDFKFTKRTNKLIEEAYLKQRRLDRKTNELMFIVSFTVMRARKKHIQNHVRVVLDHAATKEEILEAIEISFPEAGAGAYQAGFDAWREVVGAEGIKPTVEAYERGSGSDDS